MKSNSTFQIIWHTSLLSSVCFYVITPVTILCHIDHIMVCFHCPIPIPRPTPSPTPMQIQKGYTGPDSDGDSYAKSQWKLVKFHLIITDVGAKMGTVAIGIGIGTCIGI